MDRVNRGGLSEALGADLRRYLSFSDELYLANNPDVREAGLDPFQHFLRDGRFQRGRTFGFHTGETWAEAVGFDASWYLQRYPDVAAAGVDPVWHFWRWGFPAGRAGTREAVSLAASPFWEQLGGEPDLEPLVGAAAILRVRLAATDCDRARETLRFFLRRGPRGLHASEAAILLGWLALRVGEPVVAEAFFETYRLGPPYFFKPGETTIGSVSAYPAQPLADFCTARGITLSKVARRDRAIIPAYDIVGKSGREPVASRVIEPGSPDLFAVALADTMVFPGQEYLLSSDGVIIVSKEEFDRARCNEGCLSPGLVALANGFAVVERAGTPTYLPEAIPLWGPDSRDISRWLLNQLPRVGLALPRAPHLALTEMNLPPQFGQWATLAFPDLALSPVAEPCTVGTLHLVTAIEASDVVVNDPERGGPVPLRAFEWVKAVVGQVPSGSAHSRLFVLKGFAEPSGLVNHNSVVLQEELARTGFVTLDPGQASVREQVAAFGTASAIVAEIGPALVNLVACRPGTPILVLTNGSKGADLDLVARAADQAGCTVTFYAGQAITRSDAVAARYNYLIDVAEALRWIEMVIGGDQGTGVA